MSSLRSEVPEDLQSKREKKTLTFFNFQGIFCYQPIEPSGWTTWWVEARCCQDNWMPDANSVYLQSGELCARAILQILCDGRGAKSFDLLDKTILVPLDPC